MLENMNILTFRLSTLLCATLLLTGCLKQADNEVVVYAALDREFSESVLADVGKELNIAVRARYDVESNKTVGLANAILAESKRPRCDVFWNNEILHTLRLQQAGLLEAWVCEGSNRYPANFVSKRNEWYGFAARARVLIVNTELVAESDRPTSVHDLLDPKWRKRCAIARPLFGTSATHAAVMYHQLGDQEARKFYGSLAENAVVLGGNKQVAQKVATGQYAFGLTDTDDAIIEIENAKPVAIVFPDQAEGQLGTLLIPNTLSVIKGGPNSGRAKKLVQRLLAADIETRLASGLSAQIPIASDVESRSRVEPESGFRSMEVDFHAAAENWTTVATELMKVFPTGG